MKMVTGVSAAQTAHAASMMTGAAGTHSPLKEPVKGGDRRSNKPIMEKRRRARINNCLNELKTLILDATKKDPARHSKLEKADILEKTVKYLQDLQRQQIVMSQATDPKVVNKFKAGFTECANEVSRFPGIDPVVRRRLLQHLSNCMNGVKTVDDQQHSTPSPQIVPSVQVHMLPSPPSSPEQQDHQLHNSRSHSSAYHPGGYFLPNGLRVIPTKLQNGSYALVVPSQSPQLPTLVPIPRTSSTSSATSACSMYERLNSGSPTVSYTPPSPPASFEMMDYKPSSMMQHGSESSSHNFQYLHVPPAYSPSLVPLALVVKKERDDEQPWRPW